MELYAQLQEIAGEDDFVPPGRVPKEWLCDRLMGSADATGKFADVCGMECIAALRMKLATMLIGLGIPDLDASVLQRTGPRSLTQSVSDVIYKEGFSGIRYLSKYGHDIENWALFEPAYLTDKVANDIKPDDPDLLDAFRIFNLEIE
jgi:hypothetical protein